MPAITTDTPRSDYTIAGKTFAVAQPYTEGHVLTANEASAMNQVLAENVRNNFATKVKAANDSDAFDQDAMQTTLDEYVNGYQFGVRSGGGGRTGDPVEARAIDIARKAVRNAIVKRGGALKDFTAAAITERAKKAVADNPKFREQAQRQIEEEAGLDLGEVDSAPETSAPKGKRAA